MAGSYQQLRAFSGDDLLRHLDEFIPHYQPILDVTSGLVAGYEALARRVTKYDGVKPAGQVFSDVTISRHSKLAIDRHVRKQAIDYFSRRLGSGFLSVNISPDWVALLEDDSDIPTLAMIEQSGIDPGKVVVEFTEHCGDLEKLKKLTRIYHQAGIRVAIDDFGVGGSQVDRIIALQPDLIKLDMDLFRRASMGGPEADVVLSIAAIAQRAGCAIICEGVETEREFYFALECGADYIQGWLFQQALQSTVQSGSFVAEIEGYKRNYLRRKSDLQRQVTQHNRAVTQQVNTVCERLRFAVDDEDRTLKSLDARVLAELGILRLFICDNSGEQLSPNYEISPQGVSVNADSVGYNWSHRPYFPLLHALHQMDINHVVVSVPYKDIVCGCMCKTLGVFVSEQRALLVDVISNDEILFSES